VSDPYISLRLNGRFTSQRRHFKHDPYYYGDSKDYLDGATSGSVGVSSSIGFHIG